MIRHIVANAFTLMIVGLIALAVIIAAGQRQFVGPGPLTQAVCFRVAPGASLQQVSGQLAEMGAIGSPQVFRIGARYTERADQLRFGSYLVPEASSMDEIMDIPDPAWWASTLRLGNSVSHCASRVSTPLVRELTRTTPAVSETVCAVHCSGENPPDDYARLTCHARYQPAHHLAEGVDKLEIMGMVSLAGRHSWSGDVGAPTQLCKLAGPPTRYASDPVVQEPRAPSYT